MKVRSGALATPERTLDYKLKAWVFKDLGGNLQYTTSMLEVFVHGSGITTIYGNSPEELEEKFKEIKDFHS
jgi:hypothetical protein